VDSPLPHIIKKYVPFVGQTFNSAYLQLKILYDKNEILRAIGGKVNDA
jgi:arginyl-tRNA synthetase